MLPVSKSPSIAVLIGDLTNIFSPLGTSVNNFLTDTDSFFLLTDVPNGLKHFVRSPIKTAIEGDFDTGNVRFKARERYSFGFSDPRCIFGNGNLPTS